MKRRDFFKMCGVGVGTLALPERLGAEEAEERVERVPVAMLIDTTRCEGCRTCEEVCAETNGLPEPDTSDDAMEAERQTSETQFVVVNRYETDAGETFVRRQCMHCLEPACATACLTRAMLKTDEGPVIWREDPCMGCRYCMVSCPFDVPKFEYHSANPRIRKCRMCWERVVEGEMPACAEGCPGEAIAFGPRDEMLAEARRRIHEDPDTYVDHIYGEHEVGGTGVLYLAASPFEKLGFRSDLGDVAFPELTREFLYAVPVVLGLWPPFLMGLRRSGDDDVDDEEPTP